MLLLLVMSLRIIVIRLHWNKWTQLFLFTRLPYAFFLPAWEMSKSLESSAIDTVVETFCESHRYTGAVSRSIVDNDIDTTPSFLARNKSSFVYIL